MGVFKGGDPREVGRKGGRPTNAERAKRAEQILAPLPEKKRQYLLNIASGMNKKAAALAAGYTPSMAAAACVKIETEDYKRAFGELARMKIPASKIVKRINQGLDAVETKFFTNNGVVTDSRDVINWSERRKYAALAAEVTDRWHPRQELDVTHAVDESTLRRFTDLADRLAIASLPSEELETLAQSHHPLTIDADETGSDT